jgi:hypothetical protein
MRTFKIFNVLLVIGKPEELADVDALAMGTHHIQKYPTRKKKGRPENGAWKCVTCSSWVKDSPREGEITVITGLCNWHGIAKNLYDTCEHWRKREEDKDSGDESSHKEGDSGQVAGGEQLDPRAAGEAVGETSKA